MKHTKHIFFVVMSILIFSQELFSQTDKEQILAIRNSSNSALKSYDITKVLSYLTDDVLTTTGSGVLMSGKRALEEYILAGGDSKMYWVRTPKEIIVNDKTMLAWENGSWNGYDPEKGPQPVVGGNYSAMWTKESGIWKIKSQLFVALE